MPPPPPQPNRSPCAPDSGGLNLVRVRHTGRTKPNITRGVTDTNLALTFRDTSIMTLFSLADGLTLLVGGDLTGDSGVSATPPRYVPSPSFSTLSTNNVVYL